MSGRPQLVVDVVTPFLDDELPPLPPDFLQPVRGRCHPPLLSSNPTYSRIATGTATAVITAEARSTMLTHGVILQPAPDGGTPALRFRTER
jgi:hypothetical protein